MTIRPGEPWGAPVDDEVQARYLESDRDLSRLLESAGQSGVPTGPVALRGGDLLNTLGGTVRERPRRRLPIDVLRVTTDIWSGLAVAHVVARRVGWLRGPIIVIANAEYLGRWKIAPRSHPNDGRFDITEVDASMGIRQRLVARRRLASGTHVPHPSIRVASTSRADFDIRSPLELWIDGERIGRVRKLAVEIEADAAELYL